MRRALLGREDPRLPAPLRRRGGGRGGRDAGARAGRRGRLDLSRARPRARARRARRARSWRRCSARSRGAAAGAAARCTSSTCRAASTAATRSSRGGLPLAVGLALGDSMQGRRRVTACFFGDGATAEGEFHESLNLAALWKLPVLFLCENNQYAMGTALRRHQAETNIARKADELSDARRARRRDGRRRGRGGRSARRRARPRREGARTSSSSSPTAFVPTRCSTRSSIAIARRSSAGSSAIRSSSSSLAARAEGRSRTPTSRGSSSEVAREVADAVAFAEAGTLEPVETLLQDVTTPREVAS